MALAASAAVVLGAAACGGGDAGADLQISGGLQANAMASGGECRPVPGQAAGMLGDFYLDLDGLHYGLHFLTDHGGPGSYQVSDDATFVALNGEGPGWSTLTDDAGTLVVNPDGRSGSLDARLTPEPGSDNQPIRVVGTWRCPGSH